MENAGNGVVVNTLVIKGCEAAPVTVRATVRPDGAPGVEIDGLSETARVEMRAAVRCALGAAGYWLPRQGVHIEIAPDVRGRAVSGLELPVAAAILAASGQIPKAGLDECRLVGDLSPEGKVLPSEGVRLFQTQLPEGAGLVASRGCDGDVLPAGRYASEVLGIGELGELRRGVSSLTSCSPGSLTEALSEDVEAGFGEDAARAVEVACAGGHNLLLKGADEAALMAAAGSVAACMPAPTEAEVRRTVEAARDFARKEDDRPEAFSDDPEDLVARTIADLAAARAPELSLDALASEKAMVAQALGGEGLAARTGDAR